MEIYPGLLRSDFLLTDDGDCHAWKIWLWDSVDAMVFWSDTYGNGDVGNNADACHCPNFLICDRPMQVIGNIHFVKGKWDMETVSHEMLHGLFIYLKCFVPDFPRTIYMNWMEDEEPICYKFGSWVDWIYRWLWKRDNNTDTKDSAKITEAKPRICVYCKKPYQTNSNICKDCD